MKYYLIVGEASGDLHASNLMKELKALDPQAEFRYFGGDLMQTVGGTLVRHYRQMAFMGFGAVLANWRTILGNFSLCKRDIAEYQPDVIIPVDYPSFNLRMAKYVKRRLKGIPVYYYVSPKIWAWKTFRVRNIKRYIDRVLCILPFETDFYRQHGYKNSVYVGNPSLDSVENRPDQAQTFADFVSRNALSGKPLVALLAGSRRQEIRSCLPRFSRLIPHFPEVEFVVAGAPGIEPEFYERIIGNNALRVISGKTYALVNHAAVAIVNSGTASLETALLNTPQVVAYGFWGGKPVTWLMRRIIKVKWASLVNLIAGREVVRELLGADFTFENLLDETLLLLNEPCARDEQFEGYAEVRRRLGQVGASRQAATQIYEEMKHEK